MQNQEKIQVKFEELNLEVWASPEHEWLLETALVAQGYGVSEGAIRSHKSRNSGEFVESKHFTTVANCNGGEPKVFWTKRGVIRLGFFIKSERAKLFRDWAEDLIIANLSNAETIPVWFKDFQILVEKFVERLDTRITNLERLTAHLPKDIDCFVYIMHEPTKNEYKIGRSAALGKRKTTMHVHNAEVEIIMTIPCPNFRYATIFENFLHTHFADKLVHGEWYQLVDDDLILIHTLTKLLGLV